MSRLSFSSFKHQINKGALLTLVIAFGLLSIVGSGGGGGGGGGNAGKLQFSAASYSGNEDAGAITVTVTRTGGSDGAATVDVSDAGGGTATSGADYTAIPTTTLSWADGDASAKTYNVAVTADATVEADETVDLVLGNVTGATLGATTATTVTILNDDPAVNPGTLQFSLANYSGDEDAGDITVTVTRTGGSDGAATVDVSDASSGSATSGTDYTAISTTTLNWTDGDASAKTFVVSAIADGTVEPDETVDLALDNATGASLGATTSTTVTILNDDIAANPGTLQFSLSNYSVAEGDGNATITVTRTGGSTGAVGVSYATSDNTANAGSDYTAVSSTLGWADGESGAQTFQVPIIDDTDVEVPETVNLTLSSPTGSATLGTPNTATLTISSEDKYGTLRFSTTSYNVNETDGTVTNVITLQRVDGSSGAVSVNVTDLASGTATGAGTDYTFTSPATVNWSNGDTADKYVTITLVDDVTDESTETVNLSLGNAGGGASIGTPSTTTVNIADDDAPAAEGELQFDAATYSVAENGASVTITVNRVNGTSGTVGVSYATSDNTATAGSDYTAASGTLSWGDGVGGAQSFTVDITNDVDVEGDETVTLSLTSPTGDSTLGTPSVATLIINDDDTNLSMEIGDGSYWVAFQDGPTGTWTEWSPTSGNIYDFPVTDGSGRYGVAFHRQETNGIYTAEKTYVIQATLGELSSLNAFHNAPYTVSGTLSGYTGSNDSAIVAMHTKGFYGRPLALPNLYSIARVSAGTRDLLAFELDSVTDQAGNFYLQRNINISGDLAGQDVDFATDGTAVTFTQHNFTGTSAGQELEVYYATDNGTSFEIMSDTYDGSTALTYPYLTNSEFGQAGDVYSFQIFKTLGGGTGGKYRIRNQTATTDPGDRSMGLGSLESLTVAGTDSTQTWGLNYTPDASSFSGSPVFRGYQIDLDQTEPGRNGGAHWQLKISAGWLGASTSYTYPSLSAVNGFGTSWALTAGTSTRTDISAVTSNNGTGLSLILRKTMGLNSNNIDPESVTIAKKLAQNDGLKVDIAQAYYLRNW
jgi:hypothetical protein